MQTGPPVQIIPWSIIMLPGKLNHPQNYVIHIVFFKERARHPLKSQPRGRKKMAV